MTVCADAKFFFAIRIPYAKLLNKSISYNLFTMFENISKMSNFFRLSCKEETRFIFSIVVSIENETFFRKQFLSQEGKLCTHFVNEKKWFSGINWFSIQV